MSNDCRRLIGALEHILSSLSRTGSQTLKVESDPLIEERNLIRRRIKCPVCGVKSGHLEYWTKTAEEAFRCQSCHYSDRSVCCVFGDEELEELKLLLGTTLNPRYPEVQEWDEVRDVLSSFLNLAETHGWKESGIFRKIRSILERERTDRRDGDIAFLRRHLIDHIFPEMDDKGRIRYERFGGMREEGTSTFHKNSLLPLDDPICLDDTIDSLDWRKLHTRK